MRKEGLVVNRCPAAWNSYQAMATPLYYGAKVKLKNVAMSDGATQWRLHSLDAVYPGCQEHDGIVSCFSGNNDDDWFVICPPYGVGWSAPIPNHRRPVAHGSMVRLLSKYGRFVYSNDNPALLRAGGSVLPEFHQVAAPGFHRVAAFGETGGESALSYLLLLDADPQAWRGSGELRDGVWQSDGRDVWRVHYVEGSICFEHVLNPRSFLFANNKKLQFEDMPRRINDHLVRFDPPECFVARSECADMNLSDNYRWMVDDNDPASSWAVPPTLEGLVYGAKLKIRHEATSVGDQTYRLHSLTHNYPNGTGQQIISCYNGNNPDDWWIIYPPGKEDPGMDGVEYKFNEQHANFAEHERQAVAWGGHVASITNREELEHVRRLAKDQTVWIGARRQGEGMS